MMKTLLLLFRAVFLCVFFACISHAQDPTRTWKHELSFRILYHYSSIVESPGFQGLMYGPRTTHNLTFRLGVGSALGPNVSLVVEPTYSLQLRSEHARYYLDPYPLRNISIHSEWSHRIGFLLGPVFSVNLSAGTQLLLGAKTGLLWLNYHEKTNNYISSDYWSIAERVLPAILVGIRAFSGDSWALLFQVEYSRIPNYEGHNRFTHSQVDAGIGIGFYR